MPNIKINDKDYDTDSFSDETKKQFNSLIFVRNEVQQLEMRIAALKTAEIAYSRELTKQLAENDNIN